MATHSSRAQFDLRVNTPHTQIMEKDVEPPEITSLAASPIEWTEEEEKHLVRKIDRLVMPLLILGFFALQLDRGNMYDPGSATA